LRALLPISTSGGAASRGAVLDLQPNLFPFFPPAIRALAMLANFLWQVLFFILRAFREIDFLILTGHYEKFRRWYHSPPN
jgi:hypothetical protein